MNAQGFAIEEVHGLSALLGLRDAWSRLWERCPSATPFQHPGWLLSHARCFDDGAPWAVLFRRADELVGIAPLCTRRTLEGSEIGLLGTGISDILDILAEPARARPVADALFDHLARCAGDDVVHFEQLRAGSPLLAATPPRGFHEDCVVQAICPVLRLARDEKASGEALPRAMRDKLRYYGRRAARAGEVRFELADAATLDELMRAVIRLHALRWSARGQAGVLADEAVQRFHREVARELSASGLLRLRALRLDDRIIAALYGFHAHGRAYYYLGGFDPAFEALSAGTLIVGHAIDEATREGAAEFDFLRGQEAYKYHFGAEDRPNHRRWMRRAPIGSPDEAHVPPRVREGTLALPVHPPRGCEDRSRFRSR